MANNNEGFLGRWSQRKQAIRSGKPTIESDIAAKPIAEHITKPIAPGELADTNTLVKQANVDIAGKPEAPLLTMQDVHQLTAESDFSPFVAKNVSAEVRNTAMKKLFTDPHYNVMDRLDIYIDDYSLPDPLPESMLRQMASAKFLSLFKDEENEEQIELLAQKEQSTQELKNQVETQVATPNISIDTSSSTVASTYTTPLSGTNNDHSNLRLQQNHATGRQEPGRSAE